MEKVIITGGGYRGRKIATPGGKTHPMGSRERLALFNMLGGKIEGASILDAYAGSGALGIEALSRGASSVIFVDKAPETVQAIKSNLATLGIGNEARVIKESLPLIGKEPLVGKVLRDFDIILVDPPYDNFNLIEVESLINLLKSGGILVLSHPDTAPEIDGLKLLKTRQYAAAHLSIYAKN